MTDATHCSGTTLAGAPCRARLNLSSTGLCLSHDPERREQARAIQAAGGRAAGPVRRQHRDEREAEAKFLKGVPPKPETLEEIANVQAWVAFQTYTGKMDARTSEATTKALRNQQLIIEKKDLEREVQALRAELAAAKGNSKRPRLA